MTKALHLLGILVALCNVASAGVIILPAKNPNAPGGTFPVPFVQYDVDFKPQPLENVTLGIPNLGMDYAELKLFPVNGSADVLVNSSTLDGDEMTSIFSVPSEGLWISAFPTDGDKIGSLAIKSVYGRIESIGDVRVAVPVTEINGKSMAVIGVATAILLLRGTVRVAG